MKNTELSANHLAELLAARRVEIPGDDYFRTVVPNFHRRLRIEAARQPSVWEIFMERYVAPVFANVSPALRYATACSGVALILAVGLQHSWNDSEATLLTLQVEKAQSTTYASANITDAFTDLSIDQKIDQASLGMDLMKLTEKPAHYVLTSVPVSYDTVAAF